MREQLHSKQDELEQQVAQLTTERNGLMERMARGENPRADLPLHGLRDSDLHERVSAR